MIIIPMAGASSRFFQNGYRVPKFMLELKNKSVFEHSVSSFSNYFDSEKFVFVCRDEDEHTNFVSQKVLKMGIKNSEVIKLNAPSRGQAETVLLSLDPRYDEEPIIIFNIDTFRPNYVIPKFVNECSGYLEVFKGEGANWSFIDVNTENDCVLKTTEKEPISDLCCTGLYYFQRASLFKLAYYKFLENPSRKRVNGELYVAPIYNELIEIEELLPVKYDLISSSDVVFCGVPSEYEELKESEL
jgi:choline kinase